VYLFIQLRETRRSEAFLQRRNVPKCHFIPLGLKGNEACWDRWRLFTRSQAASGCFGANCVDNYTSLRVHGVDIRLPRARLF
jgi:hypothetical protein